MTLGAPATLVRRSWMWLRGAEARRAVLMLVGGTTFAQAIVILTSPVLTRLYDPAAFGEYVVAMSVISLFASVACLTYHYAIPLPSSDRDAADVLALCVVLATAFGLGFLVVLLVAGSGLLAALGAGSLASAALLVGIGQVGTVVNGALIQWSVRTKAFTLIATNSLVSSTTMVSAQVVLGLAGLGALGLLVGAILGTLAAGARLARTTWRHHSDALRQVTVSGMHRAAIRYRRFAILSTPSVLLNTLGLRGPVLLLVALYGPTVGGQYALAERVVALPVTLIAGAVDQVYVAHAAQLARSDPDGLQRLFMRTSAALAAIAIGPTVAAFIFAPALFGFIFGPDWVEAGVYVSYLAPWIFFLLIASPTGGTLDVLERQDLHLIREVARLAILAFVAATVVVADLPSTGAVIMLAIGGASTYALYWLISCFAIVRWRGRERSAPVASDQDRPREDRPAPTGR